MKKLLAAFLIFAVLVTAQTQVFYSAPTLPLIGMPPARALAHGASVPVSCTAGQTYILDTTGVIYNCGPGLTFVAAGGSGTVTVVGAGTLTANKCVTGGGSQTIQTPSSNCSVDSSGNLVATSVSAGASPPACVAGTAGDVCLNEGTAPTGLAGAGQIYPKTDHFLYVNLNNGGEDKICTLAAGCGGSSAFSYYNPPQNAVPLTASEAVLTGNSVSLPALAAGKCYLINTRDLWSATAAGNEILYLDSTALYTKSGGGLSGLYWSHSFLLCNNSGVTNAQTFQSVAPTTYTIGAGGNPVNDTFQVASTQAFDFTMPHTLELRATGVVAQTVTPLYFQVVLQ